MMTWDLWPNVAQKLMVEEGVVVLSQCCRSLANMALSEDMQRSLWQSEGILWAADTSPPRIDRNMDKFLARWRRGTRANNTCHTWGKGMSESQAFDVWTFDSLATLQLVDAVFEHAFKHRRPKGFLLSEVSIPKVTLQQVLAGPAQIGEFVHLSPADAADDDSSESDFWGAAANLSVISERVQMRQDGENVSIRDLRVTATAFPLRMEDTFRIGTTQCFSFDCYLLDELHNIVAHSMGDPHDVDPVDFFYNFGTGLPQALYLDDGASDADEGDSYPRPYSASDDMAFEWLEFLCSSASSLPVKVIIFAR